MRTAHPLQNPWCQGEPLIWTHSPRALSSLSNRALLRAQCDMARVALLAALAAAALVAARADAVDARLLIDYSEGNCAIINGQKFGCTGGSGPGSGGTGGSGGNAAVIGTNNAAAQGFGGQSSTGRPTSGGGGAGQGGSGGNALTIGTTGSTASGGGACSRLRAPVSRTPCDAHWGSPDATLFLPQAAAAARAARAAARAAAPAAAAAAATR